MDTVQIRAQLEDKLKELEQRSAQAERHASHRDEGLSADFAEQAVERENDEVLSAIADESEQEALQIRQTLTRMDKGLYGICSGCGEAITPARLAAIPYTSHCVDCAE
ncbi:MAG: conjugal transfer protein TraR [Thalassolituus sp.]|nr:MAG: conjugal transfer protein TraR [Thalassolituus sp.]